MSDLILAPEPNRESLVALNTEFFPSLKLMQSQSGDKEEYDAKEGDFVIYKGKNLGNNFNAAVLTYTEKVCKIAPGNYEGYYNKTSEKFQEFLVKSKEDIKKNPYKHGTEFLLMLEDGTALTWHCHQGGAKYSANKIDQSYWGKKWINISSKKTLWKGDTFYSTEVEELEDSELVWPDRNNEVVQAILARYQRVISA